MEQKTERIVEQQSRADEHDSRKQKTAFACDYRPERAIRSNADLVDRERATHHYDDGEQYREGDYRLISVYCKRNAQMPSQYPTTEENNRKQQKKKPVFAHPKVQDLR